MFNGLELPIRLSRPDAVPTIDGLVTADLTPGSAFSTIIASAQNIFGVDALQQSASGAYELTAYKAGYAQQVVGSLEPHGRLKFLSAGALLKKANQDFADLKSAYESSLHEKHVREDLKVSIKNIFENLHSCLDYLAQDIFEKYCKSAKKPDHLYFPIRTTPADFLSTVSKDYPQLNVTAKAVFYTIESIQPYHASWLGQFNKLNNLNKYQDLVEQTRIEARHVTVSSGGGSVSWGPGVTFGSGVSVTGVPIDPRTQMPLPNTVAKTEVVTWVDFRFKEIDQPALGFIDSSLKKIAKLFQDLKSHISSPDEFDIVGGSNATEWVRTSKQPIWLWRLDIRNVLATGVCMGCFVP